ncbi:MAG TPA: hypothetical protein VIU85_03400 [Chthoniobacterales bacterium]
MVGLIFLGLGILLMLIGRILLISAAFGVSIWWGFGIFLPFGPMLFRMNYPDVAPLSRTFRLFALPCILAYFVLGPGSLPGRSDFFKQKDVPSAPANHYGLEKSSKTFGSSSNLDARRTANAKEMERLTAWAETLHVKKRDLLRSDAEGTKAFNNEVGEFNTALAKATAEQAAIWPQVTQKK